VGSETTTKPRRWAALGDVAHTTLDMTKGTCAPKAWLSSCDPDCRKAQTVAHLTGALLASAWTGRLA